MNARLSVMTLAVVIGLSGALWAVQNQKQTEPEQRPDVEIQVEREREPRERENLQETTLRQQKNMIHRASALIGLEVKNAEGRDLGDIDDLTITNDGKVEYAAMSFGGFAGIGDKLFAVPWDEVQIQRVENEWVAVVNVNEQTLENAQGFDKDNWPNMADEQWRTQNDRAFRTTEREREAVTPRR